jgi:hypothetical protein
MKAKLATAMALTLLTLTPAMARDGSDLRPRVPASQWLSPAQMVEKLTAQGYRVREIEADDGVYEVELTDKNGVRIEVDVHPATGAFLPDYDD